MIKKLAHIGIAVNNLSESTNIFKNLFGIIDVHHETVVDQKVNITMFEIGETHIELLEGISTESPISKFIERRGEGIHHLSFDVDNIEHELVRLKAAGFQLIDEKPRLGANGHLIAFIHPKSTNGILIELSQKKNGQ